jgi:hypothetical protein
MKRFLALLLLAFASLVHAQTSDPTLGTPAKCAPDGTYGFRWGVKWPSLDAPTETGMWVSHWCLPSVAYGQWRLDIRVLRPSLLTVDQMSALAAAGPKADWLALDKVATLSSYVPEMRVIWNDATADIKTSRPAGPWLVPYTAPTAPVYPVVSGARQTRAISGVRASAGTRCLCDTQVLTGGYCALEGYSFRIQAPNREAAKVQIAAKMDEVVAAQPSHAQDKAQAVAAAAAFIDLLKEDENRDVVVDMHGSLSGTWVGNDVTEITHTAT